MDIACVLDITHSTNLAQRKRALEEVRLASDLVNANLHHVPVSIRRIFCLFFCEDTIVVSFKKVNFDFF